MASAQYDEFGNYVGPMELSSEEEEDVSSEDEQKAPEVQVSP